MEFSDRVEKHIVTTNQAILKLMAVIRPSDDVNQTNQRLRRKWHTQRMYRVSAQDARILSSAFPDMAYMKFRAGLVLIEWPESSEILGYLTADKQARPRRLNTTVAKSKQQLIADLRRAERENEQLRSQMAVMQNVIDSMMQRMYAAPTQAQAVPYLPQPQQPQPQPQSNPYAMSTALLLQQAMTQQPVSPTHQQQQQHAAGLTPADSAAAVALATLTSRKQPLDRYALPAISMLLPGATAAAAAAAAAATAAASVGGAGMPGSADAVLLRGGEQRRARLSPSLQ